MKIAFIGLGAMGYPMARHLAKAHEVTVWNRTAEKAAAHSREHGTRVAKDLADCAASDVIITMLPTSVEVDEVVDKLLTSLRKGTVWIDAEQVDDELVFRVRDEGRGIPADKLETIFEPFVQLEGGLTNRRGGVGLGLAISRDMARAMNGDITVDSTVGIGSRFTLALPRAAHDATPAALPSLTS